MNGQKAKQKARELMGLAPVGLVIGLAAPAVYSLTIEGHPLAATVAVPLMVLAAYSVGMWDMHTGQRGAALIRWAREALADLRAMFTRGGGAHE